MYKQCTDILKIIENSVGGLIYITQLQGLPTGDEEIFP
jgi:hypothetical protein